MDRAIRYPAWVTEEEKSNWETQVVTECRERGVRRFPEPYPTIFDREDQISAFLYGVTLALYKVDWAKGDPIEFLVNNGIWYLRTQQYRAMGKRMIFKCEGCGRRLYIGDPPCHYSDGKPTGWKREKQDFQKTRKQHHGKKHDYLVVEGMELATDLIEQYSDERQITPGLSTWQSIMEELIYRKLARGVESAKALLATT
jgi:hypothetical protein